MASPSSVRPALRRLVTAMHNAFKGDDALLSAGRATLREHLSKNANAKPDKIPDLVQEMDTAATFLRTNVVQAQLNQRGNYAVDVNAIDESKQR